jgi:hypothetical protein
MKRFRQSMFYGVSALSLALCVATLAIWARSYWHSDQLIFHDGHLYESWKAYIAKEGDGHRSDLFEQVSLELEGVRRSNPAVIITEREALSFLGLPDCGLVIGNDSVYVYYYYWRTETKSGWEVMISTIHDGRFVNSGWNDAFVNDFSKCKKYRTWSDVLGPTK